MLGYRDYPNQKMQDESLATYCRKLNKEDGNLDFSSSANQLVDRIRAFSSWPGCGFFIDGQKIRIGSAVSFKNDFVASARGDKT